jgi:tRNA A-37 threonylcarbamoyl transferase component Bud32
MNNLYQLVVDANKILVEGGLKPPEVHLQLSPNDPEMFSICHRQICRERANAHLLECSNGSYLVRESRSDPLSLVLNVIVSGELRSFKIEHSKERDEFSIFNHHPFPSLSSLLQSCEKGNVGNLPMSPMSHQTPKYLAEQNIHFPIIDDWKFERSPSVSDVSISSFLDGFNESQPLTAEDIPPLMFIPHESLTKGKLIGEGNFSQVYKGLWQSRTGERKEVAIKVLKDRQAWREMQAEAERMHQLKNDNIVEIFGCSVNTMENECMVITEYVSGGDLKSFMRRRMAERQPLDNGTQMRFASQIAFGMSHLAENNMVHRDLAARNVLVNSNNVVKITDFGLSRKFSEGKMYYVMHMSGTQTALPLYWYAPECLVDYKFSKYSDVWSFGVLLFEIFSHGDEPYKHYYCPPTFDGIKKALTVDRQRLPKPKDCPQHVYEDIMLKCWELEPSQRPDFMTLAINLTDMNIHS